MNSFKSYLDQVTKASREAKDVSAAKALYKLGDHIIDSYGDTPSDGDIAAFCRLFQIDYSCGDFIISLVAANRVTNVMQGLDDHVQQRIKIAVKLFYKAFLIQYPADVCNPYIEKTILSQSADADPAIFDQEFKQHISESKRAMQVGLKWALQQYFAAPTEANQNYLRQIAGEFYKLCYVTCREKNPGKAIGSDEVWPEFFSLFDKIASLPNLSESQYKLFEAWIDESAKVLDSASYPLALIFDKLEKKYVLNKTQEYISEQEARIYNDITAMEAQAKNLQSRGYPAEAQLAKTISFKLRLATESHHAKDPGSRNKDFSDYKKCMVRLVQEGLNSSLKWHRGWAKAAKNLLYGIIGLGVFYFIGLAATYKKRGTFFLEPESDTTSIKRLKTIADDVKEEKADGPKRV